MGTFNPLIFHLFHPLSSTTQINAVERLIRLDNQPLSSLSLLRQSKYQDPTPSILSSQPFPPNTRNIQDQKNPIEEKKPKRVRT